MRAIHTPTPWTLFSDEGINEIKSDDGLIIVGWGGFSDSDFSESVTRANARFIVQACDSHDGLLKACQNAAAFISSPQFHSDDPDLESQRQYALEYLYAAINRAERKTRAITLKTIDARKAAMKEGEG